MPEIVRADVAQRVRPSEKLVAELEQDLPDIEGRLIGRGCDFDLTLPEDAAAPGSLATAEGFSLK